MGLIKEFFKEVVLENKIFFIVSFLSIIIGCGYLAFIKHYYKEDEKEEY